MLDVSPNTATVRLTVTIVQGEDTRSREFVAEVGGTARPTRAAYNAAAALRADAVTWIQSLRTDTRPRPEPVRVSPVPVTGWQRFLLAAAKLPVPTRITVPNRTPRPVDDTEPATVAASISVDSDAATDTVSLAGNVNGAPYELASELVNAVAFDLRERLADLRYALENAR